MYPKLSSMVLFTTLLILCGTAASSNQGNNLNGAVYIQYGYDQPYDYTYYYPDSGYYYYPDADYYSNQYYYPYNSGYYYYPNYYYTPSRYYHNRGGNWNGGHHWHGKDWSGGGHHKH